MKIDKRNNNNMSLIILYSSLFNLYIKLKFNSITKSKFSKSKLEVIKNRELNLKYNSVTMFDSKIKRCETFTKIFSTQKNLN